VSLPQKKGLPARKVVTITYFEENGRTYLFRENISALFTILGEHIGFFHARTG
jgi:hypothetical protein